MLQMTEELSSSLEAMNRGELYELESYVGELEEIVRNVYRDQVGTAYIKNAEIAKKCLIVIKAFRQYIFELRNFA